MKSKKINKKKQMVILWVGLAVILVVFLLIMAVKYSPVKKAQDIIISGLLAFTDDYDEYENNRKEMLRVLDSNFDMGYTSGYGSEMWNALVDLHNTEEDIANELLEMAGYGNKSASRWVSYGTFGQYYLQEGIFFIIIIIILAVAVGTASLLYKKDMKTELAILDDAIIGKKSNGKTVQFLLKDIKSVETTKTQGLKITGAGINYVIHSIQNGEEMKNAIMDMLASIPKEYPVVAVSNSSASEIKEYKDLLDAGIISQEEFDAKKKELLNL